MMSPEIVTFTLVQVPAAAGGITLTEDLRIALTVQPDLYAILADSQVRQHGFNIILSK